MILIEIGFVLEFFVLILFFTYIYKPIYIYSIFMTKRYKFYFFSIIQDVILTSIYMYT